MMKKYTFGWVALLVVLLAACDTASAPTETAFDGEGDHHYYMMDKATDTRTVTLSASGMTQTVEAQVIGDLVMLEGDIVVAEQSGDLAPQAVITRGRLWPNNTVYYTINGNVPQSSRAGFLRAVDFYNKNTNIRLVQRTNQRDYIEVVDAGGCWSAIGRSGGRQRMSLSSGCSGAAQHEIGHAIGFFHEQSAPKRDQYIRIDCQTVPCDSVNWRIARNAEEFQDKYDYFSIMHYGAYSKGKQVIFPKQSGIDPRKIGRSSQLTQTDIAAVNSMYPATKPPAPGGVSNGTYRIQATGQCLDIAGISKERGTKLHKWDCWGGQNQTFRVRKSGNYYTLTAQHSGLNLDVFEARTAAGTRLIQWPNNGGANQQFELRKIGNRFQIRARHSGKCLDAGNAGRNGITVTQQNCSNESGQRFNFVKLN